MFKKYEKKVFSQNGEDGILQRIFEVIGKDSGRCLEINTFNEIQDAKYLAQLGWECDLLANDSPYDLLIVDVDGLDFYVWQNFEKFPPPSVVMIEYNASLGLENKVIEYDENFKWDGSNYFGASITALTQLGQEKGYDLLYADSTGSNLFFVQHEYVKLFYPKQGFEIKPKDIYRPPTYGNGGHPKDFLNRKYITAKEAMKVREKNVTV